MFDQFRPWVLGLIVTASFALPSFSLAQDFGGFFSRDLRLGSIGEDVRELQRFLNSRPDTRLAAAPGEAGSAGFETDYFGPLTFAAVVRLQNANALEILAPLDLDQGTGYVGKYTRAYLNGILSGAASSPLPTEPPSLGPIPTMPGVPAVPPPVAPPIVPATPPPVSPPTVGSGVETNTTVDIYAGDAKLDAIRRKLDDEVAKFKATGIVPQIDAQSLSPDFTLFINGQSAFMGKVGSTLTFAGLGFDATSNNVHFGRDFVVRNIRATGGSTITVNVPQIPLGRYDIAISNSAGVTNTGFFVVTDAVPVPVDVNNITPSSVRYGDSITIHGSGFTATDNEVRTNVGTFMNLSSTNGSSIQITVAPELLREASELPISQKPPLNMQVVVYVINNNGMSTTPKFFSLTF